MGNRDDIPPKDAGKLSKYREKRDPSATNEPFAPEPSRSSTGTRQGDFVVHLHAARRRHYDLRIEFGGVLRSFAIPKGPSLDPADKRFAVETENHPLAYMEFEAVIPEGNYGAGAMILWDVGRVHYLETTAEAGYEAGKIDFQLWGRKLRGRFALVKTSGRGSREETKQSQWLLLKKKDGHERERSDITDEQPESVLSGLRVEELRRSDEVRAEILSEVEKLGLPATAIEARRLTPMLCSVRDVSLEDPSMLYELKLDGVRILASKSVGDDDESAEGSAALYFRTHRPATSAFPEIANAVRALPVRSALLDGEIVHFDERGHPSFQRLGRRLHARKAHDIRYAERAVPVTYLVFDILELEGRDLRALPLEERKSLLAQVVRGRGFIRMLDSFVGHGKVLYDFCRSQSLEGIVAKSRESTYSPGPSRSDDWVKVKCEREDDFAVLGYSAGTGSRKRLGALLLGSYDATGQMILRGRVGSGLGEDAIETLLDQLSHHRAESLQALGVPEKKENTFVAPHLVVNVRYLGWSEEGRLRMPVFLGIRVDVPLSDCRAAPKPGDDATFASTTLAGTTLAGPSGDPAQPEETTSDVAETGVHSDRPMGSRRELNVAVSNQDKLYFKDDGYTKGDVCAYYEAVAPYILPYLKERPVIMVRYPDGIDGKWFYQWRIPDSAPPWLRSVPHRTEEEDGKDKSTVLIDNVDALLYVANLGCIPIHVIASRLQSLETCDFLTIDFDLGEGSFDQAIALAHSLRSLLQEVGLRGFPKTSGQTGLHILVPLGAGVPFASAKMLNELLGRILQARHPDLGTMERVKARRGARVYIDTGQTGRSRTIVSPYSIRATRGARVSTPLSWDEVGRSLDPGRHTIQTVIERLESVGDPMLGMLETEVDLPQTLTSLTALLPPA